jgi:predicted transcriptional regulator
MKWISFVIEDDLAQRLEELCRKLQISKSAFLRMLVIEKLAEGSMLDEGSKKAVRVLKT